MGSSVSAEAATSVQAMQAAGKTNEEIVAHLKSTNLVADLPDKPPDELAADYTESMAEALPLIELDDANLASVDAILDAVEAQRVTGTLDLGCQGESADGDPPGLLMQRGAAWCLPRRAPGRGLRDAV